MWQLHHVCLLLYRSRIKREQGTVYIVRVLARISKVAVQNNFVGMATYFCRLGYMIWVWPQFSVVEELWCFIR
jgi:hypothetical protein